MPENANKPAETATPPNAGTKVAEASRPGDQPSRPLPKATRAGSKPHLQEDAMFRVVHACAVSCRPGDLVPRSQLRPRFNGGREEMEAATDDVIERLIGLGAIAHEPQEGDEERG